MKVKLDITFHNPNGEGETADFISKILFEACKTKFEASLRYTSEESLNREPSPSAV